MSDEGQISDSPGSGSPAFGYSRHDRRRQRLEARRAGRAASRGSAWLGGAILIAAGGLILLRNQTAFSVERWWALLILIPAAGAMGNGWRSRQQNGRWSAPARSSLIAGIVLTMVAAAFLLDLNWAVLGPVLLILVGAGVLINATLPG